MKNSTKGALLSGLVFPGLGQLILKHYKKGIALMLAASANLLIIIVKTVLQALIVLEKIQSGDRFINISTILNITAEVSATSDHLILSLASLFFFLCWITGIVDAYIIGKKIDTESAIGKPDYK